MADNTGTTVYDDNGRPKTTTLDDGTVIDWAVDLGKLADATGVVTTCSTNIELLGRSLEAEMASIESSWRSDSGETFSSLKIAFTSVKNQLNDLLDDAIDRMKKAHANYVSAETTNSQMLK